MSGKELSRILWVRLVLVVLVGWLCLLTVGCSTMLGISQIGLQDVDLSKVRGVVYLSPQSSTSTPWSRGNIVFIGKDGGYQLLNISMMQVGRTYWNSDGLYFADEKFDYFIANQPGAAKKIESPKTDYQDYIDVLSNGTMVGVYNGGFLENGYDEQVVLTNKDTAQMNHAGRYMRTIASCGDDIYEIAATEPYDYPGTPITVLDSLVINRQFSNETVAAFEADPTDSLFFGSRESPCVDNVIVSLSAQSDPGDYNLADMKIELPTKATSGDENVSTDDDQQSGTLTDIDESFMTITRIDVSKKTLTTSALTFESKIEERIKADDNNAITAADVSAHDRDAIQGQKFYWFHPLGMLMETDYTNGKTTCLNDDLYAPGAFDAYEYFADISDGHLSLMRTPQGDTERIVQLFEFDLPTGKLEETTTIEGLGNILNMDHLPWSYTTQPQP